MCNNTCTCKVCACTIGIFSLWGICAARLLRQYASCCARNIQTHRCFLGQVRLIAFDLLHTNVLSRWPAKNLPIQMEVDPEALQ